MLNRLVNFAKNHIRVTIFLMGGFFILLLLIPGLVGKSKREMKNIYSTPNFQQKSLIVNEELEIKTYINKLESENENIKKQLQETQSHLDSVARKLNAISESKMDRESPELKDFLRYLKEEEEKISLKNQPDSQSPLPSPPRLKLIKVGEIIEKKTEVATRDVKFVHLPSGSFVKSTLITGVYAPINQSNPLPVLIRLDEAPKGPNSSRIPLQGCFAIGKAVGDIVSQRAIIQIITLSCVFPQGKTFEKTINGYITGEDGTVGIPGKIIRMTGEFLSKTFLSSFLSGAAAALAQAETTGVAGSYGQISRNVTGDIKNYTLYSGLSASTEKMAEFYSRQLDSLIPVVEVKAGNKGYFVIQSGITIDGLEVKGFGAKGNN